MSRSLEIGKYLRKSMVESEELTDIVSPDCIFPLIANEDTPLPYIIYSRENISSEYTKDFLVSEEVGVSIDIFSKDYTESCEIASIVRNIFELHREPEYGVRDCRLSAVYEEVYSDAYSQTLKFNIKTN